MDNIVFPTLAELNAHGISNAQAQEMEDLHTYGQKTTVRPTVAHMEHILYKPFLVLNHGFLRVIDYMGNQAAVVQAARVSYGHGTTKLRSDIGLLRYMLSHQHGTPFEMCEIKIHVKMPIFVARQWIRHRTANVNEYSARYSILDREFYIPAPEHMAAQSNENRQGRGSVLTPNQAIVIRDLLLEDAQRNYDHYEAMLGESEENPDGNDNVDRLINDSDDFPGLAKELARMNLTLNTYTQWYWKCDLRNFLNFLALRADAHAQYEIRVYADILLNQVLKGWLPDVYTAFMDYNVNAVTFSAPMMHIMRDVIIAKCLMEELHLFITPSRYPTLLITERECAAMVKSIRGTTT